MTVPSTTTTINFRRLLSRTKELHQNISSLDDEAKFRLNSYLDTLSLQLQQFREAAEKHDMTGGQFNLEMVEAFSVELASLTDGVIPVRASASLPSATVQNDVTAKLSPENKVVKIVKPKGKLAEPKLTQESIRSRLGLGTVVQAKGGNQLENGSMEEILQRQREEQDQLTGDLCGLAQQLRERSVGLRQRIQQDTKVLDGAEEATSSNLTRVTEETEQLKVMVKASASGFGYKIIGASIVLFLFAYLFMKFFSKNY